MPFHKQCSTDFQSDGGVSNRRWCFFKRCFPKRLGHFSREGMKPSPALGKYDQCMICTLKNSCHKFYDMEPIKKIMGFFVKQDVL